MKRRLAAAAVAVWLAVLSAGMASGATKVRMKDSSSDNFFQPRTMRVDKGTRVTWVNRGSRPHTTTANSGAWDSGTVNPGQSFTRRFRKTGTFRYHCEIHAGMTGKIVVVA